MVCPSPRIGSIIQIEEPGESLILREIEMTRNLFGVLYAVIMIAVVVGMDLLFFRHRILERLLANIGIVLVFAAFYLRFFKLPWR